MSSCAVCFDIVSGKCVALSECGHVFHPSCITKWFDIKKKSNRQNGFAIPTAPCVVCRVDFDISAALPVYLDVPLSALKAKRRDDKKRSGDTKQKKKKKKKSNFEKKERGRRKTNVLEKQDDEDVVVLVSGSESDGDESDDAANDDGEEHLESENENAELRRLLLEEKRKTREAEDAVVLNRCNNDAFAQSKMQLETLQVEYMQVQEVNRVAKTREKIAVDRAKNFESRVTKAESDVKMLRSEIAALKHQRAVEMDVFADKNAVSSSRFFEEEQIARLMDQKDKRMALESLARSLRMKTKHIVTLQDEYHKVVQNLRVAEKSLRDLEMKYAKRKAREKQTREELQNLTRVEKQKHSEVARSGISDIIGERKNGIKEGDDVDVVDDDDDDVDDDDDLLILDDDNNKRYKPSSNVLRDSNNKNDSISGKAITRLGGNVKSHFNRKNNAGGSFIQNGDDGRGGRATILTTSTGGKLERNNRNDRMPLSRGEMMQKNLSSFVRKGR
ncbi:unnamed protein product [Bathycoccus prasinos]